MGQSQKYFLLCIYHIAREFSPNFSPLGPILKEEIGNKGIKWPLLYIYTSSSCPGFPGKYRETGNTGQDLLVFNIIRSHKYFPFPRISRDFPGFPVISPGFPRFPEISRDFPGFPGITQDFPGFSEISRDFPRFPEISRDFPRFSEISRFPGFPVSRFPGIPVSRDSQWNANMAHCVLL